MKSSRVSICLLTVALSILFLMPRAAMAHAVVVSSMPSAHTAVKGPDVVVHIKFNSRIDAVHSRLYLVGPDGKTQTLKVVSAQESPNDLAAESLQLKAGAYTVRWQALSSDGHMTRGEIPFTVQ